jgi:hypothetical protein
MKKLPLGALILAVLMSAALAASGEEWKTYVNEEAGCSVEYPDIYQNTQEDFFDDGTWLFDAYNTGGDGRDWFSVNSHNNDGEATPESELNDQKEFMSNEDLKPIPDTEKTGDNFFTIDYYADDSNAWITHAYGVVTEKLTVTVTLTYPKEDAEKFAEITDRVDKSLKVTGK